ncbi:hypothetical protein L2D01_04135 [Hyphomonadaceae bacterium ML37]|nr:hypothetical protein L2D01_04135 [Hyphomonadaceae bacterium ML37]
MTARLLAASIAASPLAAAAHAQLPPPPQDGVSADLDCASVYVSMGALSAGLAGEETREPFSARAHAAIRAHVSANPPAAGQDEASYQAFLNEAIQRWSRGLGAGMEQLQSLGGPSSPEGMAGFIRLGNIAWDAVQACDARYGHAPLPSPFSWID